MTRKTLSFFAIPFLVSLQVTAASGEVATGAATDIASWGSSTVLKQAQGEAVTAAIDIVMNGLLKLPYIDASAKIAIRNSRSAVIKGIKDRATIKLLNVAKKPTSMSIAKYVGGAVVSAVSSAAAEELTDLMIKNSGYGPGVAITAALQENMIKTTANALLSGGNLGQFALSQTVLAVENTVNAGFQANEASEDAIVADRAALREALTDAHGRAVNSLLAGESEFEVLRDFDNTVDDIKTKPPSRRLGWFSPFKKKEYFNYVNQKVSEYQWEIRSEVVDFSTDLKEITQTVEVGSSAFSENIAELSQTAEIILSSPANRNSTIDISRGFELPSLQAAPVQSETAQGGVGQEFTALLGSDLTIERSITVAEAAAPDGGDTPNQPTAEEIAAAERLKAEMLAAERVEAERLKQERLEAARLEAERLAQLRLMRISQLEAERDSLSLTQQDAAARYKERDNRLTILRFEELPKVEAISGPVRDRIAALRTEQSTTGLIASDQQLLLDLVAYEGVLQSEQERIARGISQAQAAIARYEVTLADVGARLEANAANLAGPDYNIEDDYTPPTFVAEGLTDWTGYSYEIPAFNATKPMESTLSNVIGHAVSIPAINGVGRAEVDLVAEDNTILDQGIPGAIVELEGESSRSLDGFAHLYFGDGIDEHGDESQWIYGQASTPEEFALRSGTATFNGGVLGYYAAGTATDYTLYPESVFGELELNIDFGTKLLTGEGRIEVDNEAANYTTELSLKEAAIAEKGTGLTRSLGFDARASLDNGRSADGNFVGTLYGSDTSEAAGSFALKLPGGFAAGVWAVGENYVPGEGSEEDGFSGAFVLGYSASETGHGTFWQDVSDIYEGKITFPGGNSGEDTQVNIATTFAAEGYSHVSWGTWVSTGATPSLFSDAGLWVDVDNVTNSISLQNRSGVAQYGGEIRGGYAGQGGVEEEATGLINITADFSEQSVGGQFQFGRSCSGAGLNGCAVATEVNTFDEPINDYSGSGFGNHGRVGMSGVIGVFGGANGQEVGGHAWVVADQGQYVGVFRAREGLSFGDFVTPTVTDAGGAAEGGSGNTSTGDGGFGFTDEPEYENYRGFSAYDGTLISGAEYVLGTVAATSVSDKGVVAFQNTDVTVDASGKYADPKGNEYSYVAWGQWDFEMNGAVAEVDGELVANSRANWLVYDPTTNLQQTGTATYTGAAFGEGTGMAAGRVRGDISLTADFAKDNVTGNMNLKDNNGASWANSTFDAPIRRDADSSGFQGDLSGSNVSSGGIFGGFAGPNAEEVGGGWQIDHVNGSSANGIFRAQN